MTIPVEPEWTIYTLRGWVRRFLDRDLDEEEARACWLRFCNQFMGGSN
jgi:hypothetical protein